MQYEDDPVSIKYHVKKFVVENHDEFRNKIVIDAPAGSGVTSRILKEAGASVHAFDLFPEYFKVEGLTCIRANIMEGLPVSDGFADTLLCQEGIEHFSDQYRVFLEFNRVIKKHGSLIITTPNNSNLQARLSYFLFESEYYLKMMPPNEIDSIWMAEPSVSKEIYLGHIFLIGIQRLRLLAKLSGFRIKRFIFTKATNTSLVLLPIAYPFLWLTNWWTIRNYIRRDNRLPGTSREEIYREIMRLNLNVRLLVDKHLFVEFEKESDPETVRSSLQGQHANFDVIT